MSRLVNKSIQFTVEIEDDFLVPGMRARVLHLRSSHGFYEVVLNLREYHRYNMMFKPHNFFKHGYSESYRILVNPQSPGFEPLSEYSDSLYQEYLNSYTETDYISFLEKRAIQNNRIDILV